jgi:hypothetical protein
MTDSTPPFHNQESLPKIDGASTRKSMHLGQSIFQLDSGELFVLLRYQDGLGLRSANEFLESHRLAEQVSLDPVKTHLVCRDEISAGFHSLGNDTGPVLSGQFDDATAHRALEPVIGAAGDELSIDLQFDEGKVFQPHQGGPVRAKIVDRDRNILESYFFRDIDQDVHVLNHLGAIDLDE